MSEDIIEFYKQANTEKEQSGDAPVEEKVEPLSTEPVINETITEEQAVSEIASDPFDKFLITLNKNLKKQQTLLQQQKESTTISEAETVKESIKDDTSQNIDPFESFINKFQGIVLAQKNQQIKAKTLDFIEELKSGKSISKQVEPIAEEPVDEVEAVAKEEKDEEPRPIQNEIRPSEEIVEPVVAVDSKKEKYVRELKSLNKIKKPVSKDENKPNDIKTLINKQIEAQSSKILEEVKAYAKRILDLGGGGGSVAQQFANGGTMNGDLNVTGQYLSGGVNLVNILSGSGGGGGQSDRLVSGNKSLILNSDGTVSFPFLNDIHTIAATDNTELVIETTDNENSAYTQIALTPHAFSAYDSSGDSITFDSISNTLVFKTVNNYTWILDDQGNIIGPSGTLTVSGNLNTTNKILSGGRDLSDIFITHESDSQTLSYIPSSYSLSISNGNTVSLSSLSSAPTDLSFLSVSGNWNSAYASTTALNLSSTNWNIAYNNAIYTINGTANQITVTPVTNNSTTISLPSNINVSTLNVLSTLNVAGSAYFYNTKTLEVSSNIIYFGEGNTGNALDLGLVTHFVDGTNNRYQHTGLVRKANQSSPGVWTLFSGLTTEPGSYNSGINWSDPYLTVDTLSANVLGNLSGSFVTVGTGNSNQWNSAYNISTDYQSNSGSFATNTLLQSTSALLTPLTLTNNLTGQLVTNATLSALSGGWQNAANSLDYIIVNSAFYVVANRQYLVDTTTATVSCILPVTAATGDNITFIDYNNTWGTYPLIIGNNGNLIQTYNEPLTADITGYQFKLAYVGGSYGWKII